MSRKPGETTQQWCERAREEYVQAWEALEVEQRRVMSTPAECLDDPMLDDAGNGGGDATDELDRETAAHFRPAPRITWRNGDRQGVGP